MEKISFKDMIFERLSHSDTISKLGEVGFLETSLKDKHIKDIMAFIVNHEKKNNPQTKPSIKKLEDYILQQIEERKPNVNKVLTETSFKNEVEVILFELYQRMDLKDDSSPEFSSFVFEDLVKCIKAENASLFPLQNIIIKKSTKEKFVFVPNPSLSEAENAISTAAATNNAVFYFNTKFMQNLMDFAHRKQVKPTSVYYESNGGDIPDEYAYIEFLILHEFMHFVGADWHFEKKFGESGTLINIVADFRINYDLVKAGYSQIPLGLFSDHLNMDRQSNYQEMIDTYKKALEDQKQEQEQPPKKKSPGGEPPPDSEWGGYKVGDKVVLKNTKEIAVVTSAGELDANGKQKIEIKLTGEIANA